MTAALTEPEHATEEHEDDGRRCGNCRRRLSQGWYLCERCSERLNEDLHEVADRFSHLSAVSNYQPGAYDKSAPSGKPGTSPPGRLDVMSLRDFRSGQSEPVMWQGADGKQHRESSHDTPSILRALVYWVDRIVDNRGFEHHPDTNVDASIEFLGRQDDWIARWPEASELAAQIKHLRNRLRAATGEPNPKPSAWCIAANEDDTECRAAVFIPNDVTSTPSGVPVVRCTGKERHEYTRDALARLALANQQAKREAS